MKPSPNVTSSAYSPNGKWEALNQCSQISIKDTTKSTSPNPTSIITLPPIPEIYLSANGAAYSPDNRLLALAIADTIFMYEIDQETGKPSLLTGDLLKIVKKEKEYQEAHKALVDSEPPVLNPDIAIVLKEYVVGPDEKTKKEPQE